MEPNCLRGTRDAAWLHPWLVLLLTWAVRVRGCSAALCLALKSAAKAASDELFFVDASYAPATRRRMDSLLAKWRGARD